jgi:hypothetical protein
VSGDRPAPPVPALVRRPGGPFGWLDARLLHDRWLASLGVDAVAVLVLLAIAADHQGASFYGRDTMAALLSLERRALDRALDRLLALALVAHRPWRPGHPDGVWQLLPVPSREQSRTDAPVSIAKLLAQHLRRQPGP